jgi:transcriptional regulator with PAS, ATPase and Fis domain
MPSTLVVRWVYPSPLTSELGAGVVFGRDASSSVVLAGHESSRRHAEVRKLGPVTAIRDLGSRNGTFVNGLRVTEHPLAPGDVLRIGEWIGIVLAAPDDGATLDFQALQPGWYAGPTLARAVLPGRRVAPTDLPVIVQGETGTGKEGMARAIHAWSGRSGPFIAVNCAAIPPAMAEGELFGYRKGAFTGADRAAAGLFRSAHRGSLFLDEVLDLPAPIQTKLLRVLEQREVHPLGESHPVPIDVRILCATQEPLTDAVADRRFRADLLARLDGLTVILPPLRERREDIAALFAQLLREQTGGQVHKVEAGLVESLLLYDWPLNVRELVLLVRRLLAVHGHELLKRSMLPERMLGVQSGAAHAKARPPTSATPARASTADDASFEQLVEALRNYAGNVSRAAQSIGISRARAYRLLEARPAFDVRSLRADPES